MKKTFTASCLMAGLGSLTLLAAPDDTGQHALQARHPVDLPNLALPTGEGGVGGPPVECFYSNIAGAGGNLFGSQKDVAYPFYAEAADDFILTGDPGNPCELESVRTVIGFFNVPAGVLADPTLCWTSVKVTIYEDISFANPIPGASCPGGAPACPVNKGPAGFPCATGPGEARDHGECFFGGGVKCELKIPMSQVRTFEVGTDLFEVIIFGLEGQCPLEKDHKYWIAIAPEQQFGVCGQTGILQAGAIIDHPAMQIFELLGGVPWGALAGDLAVEVNGERPGSQPKWCPGNTNDDKVVNVQDLLNVILCWSPNPCGPVPPCVAPGCEGADTNNDGIVNVQDLVNVVLGWGACPTPANDECPDKIDISLPLGGTATVLNVDMRGATPGDPADPGFCPPLCVPPDKDVWYCINYTDADTIANVHINTTFDVFLEAYVGCNCIWPPILIGCAPGLDGPLGAGGLDITMFPGDQVCLRLINALGLPNDALKGQMHLHATPQPPFGACCFNGGDCQDLFEDDCLAGGGNFQGAGTICLPGLCPVPPNDNCVDRILVGDGATTYDSTGATDEAAVPPFRCGQGGSDIWFNYVATCGGTLVVDTCGSTYDTVLKLYDGWLCPPDDASNLGCNDDAPAGTPCAGTTQSYLSIPVVAGQEIKIRVGGFAGDKGQGVLNITCQGTPDRVIPPGVDCFVTPCDGNTTYGFNSTPIPADFFGPGSDPFVGNVALGNNNFANPPGPGPCLPSPDGFSDTIVQRQQPMEFFNPLPSTSTIDIELVQLCLKSCSPITVTYNGGQNPELWALYAEQGPTTGPGTMDATKTHENGGVFDATFPVHPIFTFEQLVPPFLVIGPFDPGVEFLLQSTNVPFVQNLPPGTNFCDPNSSFGAGYVNTPFGPCCIDICHDTIPPSDKLHCVGGAKCQPCPPPADDCPAAPLINEVAGLPFDTSTATPDGPFACFPPSQNVWVCYTASCTGTATVDTCGSAFDTTLCVYDSCAPGPPIAANDDCGGVPCGPLDSCVSFPVVAGQQYKIEIGSLGPGGPGVLNITCTP